MPELLGSAQALPKIATPASPPSGYVSIYAKSDDKVYSLSSGGTETGLVANGGGAAILRVLTQAAYNAIGSKDANTVYVVVG